MNVHGHVPTQFYLWLQKFEFHTVFTSYETSFSKCFSNHEKCKDYSELVGDTEPAIGWICPGAIACLLTQNDLRALQRMTNGNIQEETQTKAQDEDVSRNKAGPFVRCPWNFTGIVTVIPLPTSLGMGEVHMRQFMNRGSAYDGIRL